MKKEILNYESPTIKVVEIVIEKGFAASYGDYGFPGDPLDGGPTFDF